MQKLFYTFDKQHVNIHNNIYTYNILRDEKKSFCLCLFGSMLFNFDIISYMLLDVLYTLVFAEKNYCIFWNKEMRDLMIFLTCFYIEFASIKFVLSSVHQNNYKTKDRLTNSLIVFWQFSFTYIFWSQESGFFKESGVGVAFQNCKESGVGVALKITDSPSLL